MIAGTERRIWTPGVRPWVSRNYAAVVFGGLIYILRGDALERERADHPEDTDQPYAPATIAQSRRRLLSVWMLSLTWPLAFFGVVPALFGLVLTLLGIVLALSTQFEPAWTGSAVRPWTRLALLVAVSGVAVVFFVA